MIQLTPADLADERGITEEWCVAKGIYRPHDDVCEFEVQLNIDHTLWFDTETYDFWIHNRHSSICRWIAHIPTRSRLCHLLIALGAATLEAPK